MKSTEQRFFRSLGFDLRDLPRDLCTERRGPCVLAHATPTEAGGADDLETLGRYVAVVEVPNPAGSPLSTFATDFVRRRATHGEVEEGRERVGGKEAVFREWTDGSWRSAAWFVQTDRRTVLVFEALVDPVHWPSLSPRAWGEGFVRSVVWVDPTPSA